MNSEKITDYWQRFSTKHHLDLAQPNAWMFGSGTESTGNELGKLVVDGIKTATCSAHLLYELENEPLPKVGQYDILLNGKNEPLAIIRNVSVEVKKMSEVTHDFSRLEGEGDLSHEYWYDVHQLFFTELLAEFGKEFSSDMLLVCEIFEVLDTYEQKL